MEPINVPMTGKFSVGIYNRLGKNYKFFENLDCVSSYKKWPPAAER
jgi:hypothetical protein